MNGVPIDRNDCNGNPIHTGDLLRFDEQEWGEPCEFVITIKRGEIVGCGTPEDWSQWCEIIKPWNSEVRVESQ